MIDTTTKFEANDFRANNPRFTGAARAANQKVVEVLDRLSADKQATKAQIALAWLLAKKPWIVPIPGPTKLSRFDENIGAPELEFSGTDLKNINEVFAGIEVKGERYTPQQQGMVRL